MRCLHCRPHGNSISGYDWRSNPSSRWWSVARNSMSRPPYKHGAEQNWIQRETLTTDGSGSWGTGHITSMSMSGTTLQLGWLTLGTTPVPGTTLLVLAGPGVGQSRLITAVGNISRDADHVNGSIVLDRPLDDWVVTQEEAYARRDTTTNSSNSTGAGAGPVSLVAVVSSFGSKIFAGNQFNWTEVVQWYGNTLRGVMADNTYVSNAVHRTIMQPPHTHRHTHTQTHTRTRTHTHTCAPWHCCARSI